MAEPFVQLLAVEIRYRQRPVGALAIDSSRGLPVFEYFPTWLADPEDLAPLEAPPVAGPRIFPELVRTSFRGAPGLVADSLPGQFADLLTNAWLARRGIQPGEITVIDRLGYVGGRGMGALTYHPALGDQYETAPTVVDLAEATATAQAAISGTLGDEGADSALQHLLDTSGSAGGARAKAVVALGPDGTIVSGQHDVPEAFTHWLLKFDVAAGQRPGQTAGFNQVEYAYYLMALDAGLEVSTSRLLDVDGLAHFLTRRFDRPTPTKRLHVQSLAAIAHLPPENPGAHSYEQFLQVCLRLRLSSSDRRQAFRRMVFNVAAAVRDDHTKNDAFLYEHGAWRLAPAFDLTFPFIEGGGWLTHHQKTIAGSRSGAPRSVLRDLAERTKVPDPEAVIDEVVAAVRRWPDHAHAARVLPGRVDLIRSELAKTQLAD